MRPLRLLLDGFGTYRNATEIDFADVDFFALVGPTGSGKSTVIDALCFALYGTVPRWDNEKEVRNALAPSANTCQVCLVFELAGERYVAVRALARDKRGQVTTKAARLERLDASVPPDAPLNEIIEASVEQLAEGPERVKSGVQNLLGLTYEHFTQSVLLPQGGFSEFLRATPANRQRLLVELLAFGVYKEIGQRARERAQRADSLRDAAQQTRDQLADATEQSESAAAEHLKALGELAGIVDARLSELADFRQQAADAEQLLKGVRNEAGLLLALRMPTEVPGLAGQISAAESLVTNCRVRRDQANRTADLAAQARDKLPDKADTQRQLDLHARRQELLSDAERQQVELDARRAEEEQLGGQLEIADQHATDAQHALEASQRANSAAYLAGALHVGDDCPVCQQQIRTLRPHPVPADLAAARKAADDALKSQRQAKAVHEAAARAAASARSVLADTQSRLGKAADVMADVPAEADVARQLAAIVAADEAAQTARREAVARHNELTAAENSRTALVAEEQAAWAALGVARDKLVSIGAPPVGPDGRDLATAWAALVSWADAERDKRTRRFPQLGAVVAGLQQRCTESSDALTNLLTDHGVETTDLSRAAAELAGYRARAEAHLQRVRADRKKAAALEQRISALKEDAWVATELGNRLRANKFEAWLCEEALDSLITEASATLMELSGGQFELDRDERSNDLVVIDFEDAGAKRPVHTLSGGETFQASLALALALSRQVIGLSSGMRELNSMFLDEGFGTLDADTLETVASTLERLATDSDRMVGVITHVTELAERVPVRFVVSRSGTTSTLRKERS